LADQPLNAKPVQSRTPEMTNDAQYPEKINLPIMTPKKKAEQASPM
jgi:hypothetical protein